MVKLQVFARLWCNRSGDIRADNLPGNIDLRSSLSIFPSQEGIVLELQPSVTHFVPVRIKTCLTIFLFLIGWDRSKESDKVGRQRARSDILGSVEFLRKFPANRWLFLV